MTVSCIVSLCCKISGENGLTSILLQLKNQTYKDVEILPIICCLNNKSFIQELTEIKIEEFWHDYFKKKDPFYDKNNLGISKAKGEYVGFFSGDDFYSRYYLEKMVDCLEKDKASLVLCNFRSHHSDYLPIEGSIYQGHVTAGSFLVQTEKIKELGGFLLEGMADWKLVYKMMEAGEKITKVDEILYIHK